MRTLHAHTLTHCIKQLISPNQHEVSNIIYTNLTSFGSLAGDRTPVNINY